MLTINDVMTTDVFALDVSQSLAMVRYLMRLKHVRHIPIVDDENRFVGLLTHRDLLAHTVSLLADIDEEEQDELDRYIPVAEVMKKDVVTVSPDLDLRAAIPIILENKYGCLPVVADGVLVGIVTEADFLQLTMDLLVRLDDN